MRRLLNLIIIFCLAIAAHAQGGKALFDSDWRFCLGDSAAYARSDFDDSKWRRLNLPHDWSIELPISKDAPAGNDGGYYPTGTGWYRKTLTMPKDISAAHVRLTFDGVYMNSTIFLNGQPIGGQRYGYNTFSLDLTKANGLRAGKNTVAVRVDNSAQKNCRWYSGSGIYRHVWIEQNAGLDLGPEAQPISIKLSDDMATATVTLSPTVFNHLATAHKDVSVTMGIDGVGEASTEATDIAADCGKAELGNIALTISHPKLWGIGSPTLYTATLTIKEQGKTVCQRQQRFGVRSIKYGTDGFFLNGQRVKINGGCVHHDNGLLGTAAYDAAERRKVRQMKEAGFNAIRTSHNPPSRAFLDACDEMGMLVVDELLDGWREKKTAHDYAEIFDSDWQKDVSLWVERDRHHPSIVAWSIGNEVIERKKIEIVTTARKLAEAVRRADTESRPVTSALAAWDKDWEIYDPLAAQLDITGYNYMIHKAEGDHGRVPSRVMWQTESYPRDAFKNWAMVEDHPYVVGDFVWTGIDYLGESGIGRWWYDGDPAGEHYQRDLYPWHAAYCGDIDLTGHRKPISHYRDLLWNESEKLYMAVAEPDGYNGKVRTGLWATWPTWESWNWPGHEGKPIDVEVYSRHPRVRLYQDGQLVGEKETNRATQFKATYNIMYKEGTLKAEAIAADGTVAETTTLATAGKPAAIRLTQEDNTDGMAFVLVEVTDKDGRLCPNAALDLTATATGATIAAAGSADIKDTTSSKDGAFTTWKGRALVVLQGKAKAKLTVKGGGLSKSLGVALQR